MCEGRQEWEQKQWKEPEPGTSPGRTTSGIVADGRKSRGDPIFHATKDGR